MRASGAMHAGFIVMEMTAAQQDERYMDAAMTLHEWHHVDSVGFLEPPDAVRQALATLRELKLDAFARAGHRYRQALEAWDRRVQLEYWSKLGGYDHLLPRGETAIEYVDAPRPPILIDFGYPA